MGAGAKAEGLALTLTGPGHTAGVPGWKDRMGRWRSRGRRLAFLELIQASSLLSTEAEERYYTVEITEAQGGRVTGPRLHSMSRAVQGRNLKPQSKVVTHCSLILMGTVNPVPVGLKSSKFWNTWLVPKIRCMISLGTGIPPGFEMHCEGAWPSPRAS